MLTETLLRLARRYADDESDPPEVDDDDFYTYLTLAQEDLAREGELIRAVIDLDVELDDEWVDLPSSPELVDIQRAEIIELVTSRVYGVEVAGARSNDPPEGGAEIRAGWKRETGRPTQIAMGIDSGKLQLNKVADKDYTLRIYATVLPATPISDLTEPTIPARYHRYIPYGAAVLAMEGAEAEHFSPERVASIQQKWLAGLQQTRLDNRRLQRDHGEVHFSNEFWAQP